MPSSAQSLISRPFRGIAWLGGAIAWTAAPKPYLICSTDQDASFPLEGARRTYAEAKQIYALLGSEEKLKWVHEPGPHGIPRASREAMYGWMKRWLQGPPDGPAPEGEVKTEHSEDLNATPTGQLVTSLGGETASTWNMKRFGAISPPRPKFASPADLERLQSRVRNEVKKLTRYSVSNVPLNIRSCGIIKRVGYRAERLIYQSDDGLAVPGVLCRPEPGRSTVQSMILVDQRGKSAALEPGRDVEQFVRLGYAVLAIDPAGIGETAFVSNPSAPWYPFGPAWTALMVGKPLVGLRMNDIVRALDVLAERQVLNGGAIGFGRGRIGVDLLHAAALDSRFTGVIIEEGMVSYQAIARTPIHYDIYDLTLPGILAKYDLPDLIAALAPRPVWLVNLMSPVNKAVFRNEVESTYEYSVSAYAAAGAASKLMIRLRGASDDAADAFPELKVFFPSGAH
jgi:hypothetical protein